MMNRPIHISLVVAVLLLSARRSPAPISEVPEATPTPKSKHETTTPKPKPKAEATPSALAATKTAVFAGGCFWCIQPAFDKANGVMKTIVGYSGGTEPNPTYELVGSEKTGYRESIEITYDPAKISYEQLLDIYWKQINPTQ